MLNDVEMFRRAASRRLIVLLWLHVPILAGLGTALNQGDVPAVAGLAAAAASAASLAWARWGERTATRLGLAVALAGTAALVAHVLRGTPAQAWTDTEAFALLAVLAPYRDWRVAAAASVALGVAQVTLSPPGVSDLLPRLALLAMATVLVVWFGRVSARSAAAAEAALAAAAAEALRMETTLRLASEAATDLAAQATEDHMAREFQHDVGGLVDAAAQAAQGVRAAATEISGVTATTARETGTIAAASQDILQSAQTVAAAVDQLAASITKVTGEVREVSEVSFKAMDDAGSANETVQNLSDAATRIGQVVRVINKIASQTNLLALNATIEAARAGEAGMGFTVVANEVKELAHQTAAATGDIEREIDAIRTEMTRAMAAIDGMAQTVANLGGITVSVAGAMEEQGNIAQEIAANAMRAAASTESVAATLQMLTEVAARGDAAAHDGARDAALLAEKCDAVENAVRTFVTALLAA
jgi:methyl-accepting chemotaxis protein